jgi:hypothetical protein
MKLLVAIPTWNRADHLDTAVSAIAAARSMTRNCEVELFISDNCSSDHTAAVVARWQQDSPWIHHRRWEEHIASWGPDILRRALQGSDLEYDYLWLQGDDDYISELGAYDKLAEALEACAEDPPAIVHCCQTRRSLPGDERVIMGNTEDLCNTYGWHDLLGWISSLVLARGTVDRIWASPHRDIEPRSAYWHAEVLLEAAYGRNMLILTEGLIDPQDEEQTDASKERWDQAKVGQAYWYIIAGLSSLKGRGVLTKPLTLGFFRYLTYSFWDRFAVEVLHLASSAGTSGEALEVRLDLLLGLADLLGYGEERKLYRNWIEGFRSDVKAIRGAVQTLDKRIESHLQPSYSWTLLPAPSADSPAGDSSSVR